MPSTARYRNEETNSQPKKLRDGNSSVRVRQPAHSKDQPSKLDLWSSTYVTHGVLCLSVLTGLILERPRFSGKTEAVLRSVW